MHELQLNLSRQIRSNSAACGGSMDKDFSPCCPTFAWTGVSTQSGVACKRHSCLLTQPPGFSANRKSDTFGYLGTCFVNFRRGSARLHCCTWIKRGTAVVELTRHHVMWKPQMQILQIHIDDFFSRGLGFLLSPVGGAFQDG